MSEEIKLNEPDQHNGRSVYSQRELWNAEAQRYALSPTASFDSDGFLKILSESGMLDSQTRVFDLGCGPGIYSVAIARHVKEVVGVDISEEMLSYARQRALDECRSNCSFYRLDWQSADLKQLNLFKAFDVAAARLTPAINTPDDMDKLLECARRAVFMEQFINRSHPWMHLAFEIAGAGKPWDDGRVDRITEHLKHNGVRTVLHSRSAQWGAETRPWQQVADFCLRRLALKQSINDELIGAIRSEFEKRSRDGLLDARETVTLVTIQCVLA